MIPRTQTLATIRKALVPLCALALGMSAARAQAVKPTPADAPAPTRAATLQKNTPAPIAAKTTAPGDTPAPTAEDLVELSVFEVAGQRTRGYFAADSMSGTRLRTNVEDLASSMTVITTEQMDDFALANIDDIFLYEAGTEGMGTFNDFSINDSNQMYDGNMSSPTTANRIRGVGSANRSFGNFETSRFSADRILIDGAEISRGPNSSVFGLGSAAGTVNMIPATAHLTKNKNQVQLRFDNLNSFRQHLDVNRVLIRNKLAIRASQIYDHQGFNLKPSGVDTERYNVMVKYQPYRSTTITGAYYYTKSTGNRPNSIPIADAVSFWRRNGSPTWNPITQQLSMNGKPVYVDVSTLQLTYDPTNAAGAANGKATRNNLNGLFATNNIQTSGRGASYIFVNPDSSVARWTAPVGVLRQDPLVIGANSSDPYYYDAQRNTVAYYILNNRNTTDDLLVTADPVTDKNLYDWSSINLAAGNFLRDKIDTYLVQLTQNVVETSRHLLAFQASWFREDAERWQNMMYGKASAKKPTASGPTTGYLTIDVNEYHIDGTPNPNFLRPYIALADCITSDTPLLNDTYRLQGAYRLDLRQEKSKWLRWLGIVQATGYYEYKQWEYRNYAYRYAMADNHTWLPAGTPRATTSVNYTAASGPYTLPHNQSSNIITRNYNFYYVGDNKGYNVDYAPGRINPGYYNYYWGKTYTSSPVAWNGERTELDLLASLDGTGGTASQFQIQKTVGGVLQNYFLGGRLVTTIGQRTDEMSRKSGILPILLPDGKTHDFAWDSQWADRWINQNGRTSTFNIVTKPFKWLRLYYNLSDSIELQDPAYNIYGEILPDTKSKGQDYGFWLNLFNDNLTVRFNIFDMKQRNGRASATPTMRTLWLDIWDGGESRQYISLDARIAAWKRLPIYDVANPIVMEELMGYGLTLQQIQAARDDEIATQDTTDVRAKGIEVELNWSVTPHWTIKANFAKQDVTDSDINSTTARYLEERLPIWESIIDPTLAYDPNNPKSNKWFYYHYQDYQHQAPYDAYLDAKAQVDLSRERNGKTRKLVRKYRFNLTTSLQLTAFGSSPVLKATSIGGGVRWMDKCIIGWYGKRGPDGDYIKNEAGTYLRTLDANRPVYDSPEFYFDWWIRYKTKIFKRITVNYQFNVRNFGRKTELSPVSARMDGTINGYAITSPALYMLTATFDF